MKVHRERFLAAALALSAAAGCDLSASIAERISPEKPQEGSAPAAQAAPGTDESMARRGELGSEEGSGHNATGVARNQSPTFEGKALASPTKELGVRSPTKELGISSPTKELGIKSPTKELGMTSPTKELGATSPTKEAAVLASPTKER